MLKDLGFVAVDLAEFCGPVANGGCGLRYGGAVVGLLGFFRFGFCCSGGGCGWLRWWLWRMTMIGRRRCLLLRHLLLARVRL